MNDPVKYYRINTEGTMHLLAAARRAGVRRFLYASSAAVYGTGEPACKQEALPLAPRSPYAAAKAGGELYCRMEDCRMEAAVHGMGTVCLRLFNVYGARQDPRSPYAAVVPAFLFALLKQEQPVIFGDGMQTRDFIHVQDVARAFLCAATASVAAFAAGTVFNIATGTSITITTLLAAAQQATGATGKALPPRFLPARQGDIRESSAIVQRAAEQLDFHAVRSLAAGLEKTVAWMRSRGS